MVIGIFTHICSCTTEFSITEIAVTEESNLRVFGFCTYCQREVFADTSLADMYRLALKLKASALEQKCQKLLPPPDMAAADNEWLHNLGVSDA